MKMSILSCAAAAALLVAGCGDNASKVTLNGAGASFPDPVYQAWTYIYTQTGKATVNYQSIGSGAGINQIKEGTIDFAGTDAPLKAEEIKEAKLTQFPMVTGAVTPIINVAGIGSGQLKLSNDVLAEIFMGKITKWNDAKITALNPGLALPDQKITVVYRSDSSGTTNIFTEYLTDKSPDWATSIGAGKSVKWPTGIGGQKNPGVCNNVQQTAGSIGYTEYTYAIETKLTTVQLQAADQSWVNPDAKTWPLVGTTYLLVRDDIPADKKEALKAYVAWCFSADGAAKATELHYTPLTMEDAKHNRFFLGTLKDEFVK